MTQAYEKVKWYVEANARVQALGDATTLPLEEAMQVWDDPVSRVEVLRVLEAWAMGPKVELIFSQCPKIVLQELTDVERQQLIDYWCVFYSNLTFEYLKQRLQGKVL